MKSTLRRINIVTEDDNTSLIRKAEASQTNDDLAEYYDAWANKYELDSLQFGYHRVLAVMCGLIKHYVNTDNGKILDAGAGTGMLGEMMALLGYQNLVALDMSDGMLNVAREKHVYQDLHQMTIDTHMDLPDNTFGAVVAMGVFTAGCHMPPESFAELIRITKPGGHIIFSIRMEMPSYNDFKAMHDSLEKDGKWQIIEATKPFQSLPLENPDAVVEIKVFRVL